MERVQLTPQQKSFFDTFGFLAMPGLVEDCIDEITAAFEAVWAAREGQHDGTARSMIVPFIDQHERLCALLDDPRIEGLVEDLIGEGFNYAGSDGNFYVGDTQWHSDRWVRDFSFVKVAFYLDSVQRHTGCLRVIPGSHHLDDQYAVQLNEHISQSIDQWGVDGVATPALALETEPGDVVVFSHNLKHASFGGGTRRRMFTINCCQRVTEETLPVLKECVSAHARYGMERMYDEKMVATAGPQRMKHLEQVLANQDHMPAAAARWRAEQAQKDE